MKRTRAEYDNAIAILQDNTYIHPATLEPAMDAIRELRDSAFALEEAAKMIGELRPAVLAFALMMEEVLRANDHKGHWKDCDCHYLQRRLKQEVIELYTELDKAHSAHDSEKIIREAADVANFAMMIADNTGELQRTALARWAAAPPAPAPPPSLQSSKKIMDAGEPEPLVPPTLGFE